MMVFDIYCGGKCCREDDEYFLRFFQEYESNMPALPYVYDWEDRRLEQVKRLVPDTLIGSASNQFELQKLLMFWVSRNLLGGSASPVRPMNALQIIKNTRENAAKSTCWAYAVVLNEIYLSFGFRSRMIRCLPMDLRPMDCHCMTVVYSDVYQKWIAFDAAMGTYYTDEEKVPLNVKEIRRILLEGKPLLTPYLPRSISQNLRWYLCKNMIRFTAYQTSCFNMEEPERDRVLYILNPSSFRTVDKQLTENGRKLQIKSVYCEEAFWG